MRLVVRSRFQHDPVPLKSLQTDSLLQLTYKGQLCPTSWLHANAKHEPRSQGSRFFWRSKETIDVAFHYNWDDELITISTRCLERGHNYPAIFVDASKLPITKSEAVRDHPFYLSSLIFLSLLRE